MCGRYSITDPDEAIRSLFGYNGPPMDFAPRYNAAPTQSMPVVRLNHEGKRAIVAMRWGLIPSWAKEAKIGSMMINARADTVATKPAYRAAFKARHCLVLANGFYEWQPPPEGSPKRAKKQPFRIVLGTQQHARPFAFAGLWERWRDPAGEKDAPPLDTFTIVTTDAAPAIAHIHDRMPVMLTKREEIEAWLDAEKTPPEDAQKLLRPYAGADLAAYTVGLKVNNARYDGADCVEPAAPIAA